MNQQDDERGKVAELAIRAVTGPPIDHTELITLVAENHGKTYGDLRPVCFAIERAVARGHNISRYLSILLDWGVITPAASRQFSETYRTQHSSATTIAVFYAMLGTLNPPANKGIDN